MEKHGFCKIDQEKGTLLIDKGIWSVLHDDEKEMLVNHLMRLWDTAFVNVLALNDQEDLARGWVKSGLVKIFA